MKWENGSKNQLALASTFSNTSALGRNANDVPALDRCPVETESQSLHSLFPPFYTFESQDLVFFNWIIFFFFFYQ